jgi:dienelactone hydrolase
MPTIEVADEALYDRETPVRVTGVEPGATVELVTESDGWYDDGCASRTVFEADGEGVVDTAEHAPVEGYEGVAPMGWLWSMTSDVEGETGWPHAGRDPVTVDVEARVDETTVAETTTTRRPTASGVEYTKIDEDVVGGLFVPTGDGPHPGVLVLHGSDGQPARGQAALLAAHGFAAFAVHYFGEPDPLPDQLIDVPIEYFDAAVDRLRNRAEVAAGPFGVYGRSKGAEAALVLAERYEWVDAVVAVAPSEYRWQGLDQQSETETGSWSVGGESLPFAPFRAGPGTDEDGNLVLGDVYENSLPRISDDRLDAARIAIGEIDAAALLVGGGNDLMWPSATAAEALGESLAERDDAETTVRTYEDAGHAIGPPYKPTTGLDVADGMALGGTPAANARAGADFWPRALDLLDGAPR